MNDWEGARLNEAKKILAYELTELVHGKKCADEAKEASEALFGGGGNNQNMPSTVISKADFGDGMAILDVMLAAKLIPSKGEGRRLVQQGGVSFDGEKVTDINLVISASSIENNEFIIKKGKKVFHKIVIGE